MRLNKVMMHGRVSSRYCLKLAALITCQSHSKPFRESERRLRVTESDSHATLHVLQHKSDFEVLPKFHVLRSKNSIS